MSTALYAQGGPPDLSQASLEDLLKVEITSASRKEQRAGDAPAAVYVITADDIRRSGVSSLPELLRLAPGVQVARINANKWAVSIRGFNSLYSGKLLVLVDGRSIYNPLFASVLWDDQDFVLEDIERIEVVRGPGAAVWGANAVNGVINIITRRASETVGLLLRGSLSTTDPGGVAVRYGGAAGPVSYRFYSQAAKNGPSLASPGTTAHDEWDSLVGGFRADSTRKSDVWSLQGNLTTGRQRPLWLNFDPATFAQSPISVDAVSRSTSGHVLGSWTRTLTRGGSLQLQSFFDGAGRHEAIGEYDRRTLDFDVEYHKLLPSRHDLVAGGGYRFIVERMTGANAYTFTPDRAHEHLFNAFVQDEIAIAPHRLAVTAGGKFESDTFAGASVQPTIRGMWTISSRQRAWAAWSHAIRTPSLIDRGLYVQSPPIPQPDGTLIVGGAMGNPRLRNEGFRSTEAGYRLDIASTVSIDATAFAGRYQDLVTQEPLPLDVQLRGGQTVATRLTQFRNTLGADTRGLEMAARVRFNAMWRADGTLTTFSLTPRPTADTHSPWSLDYDGHAPKRQWRGHAAFSPNERLQADLHVSYVGGIGQLGIPGYARTDARVEWRLTRRLSVAAQGQNLFDGAHREFDGADTNQIATLVPRSVGLKFTWRF